MSRSTVDDRPAKSHHELQTIYEDAAPWFDRVAPLDDLTVGRYRRAAFGDCDGRVLEVASGAGENLAAIPDGADLVCADLSVAMLDRARDRADEGGRPVAFARADAGELPFADDSFDYVCTSLSTCTIPDPVGALREVARVCRPEGEVRLLEHGRSYLPPIASLQDRLADRQFESMGCRWNQQPLALVRESGLEVRSADRYLGGIISVIAATPPAATGSAE